VLAPYSAKPHPAFSEGCILGLLESSEVREEDYLPCLSKDERQRFFEITNHPRRVSWLSGRMAAKYVFLSRLELAQRSANGKPILVRLSPADLRAYSAWMYQKIEVLPNRESATRYPGFIWCGEPQKESISLSHTAALSCACFSLDKPASIDLEITTSRVDAFYRYTFTKAERDWVARHANDDAAGANWLFTLLWTLKESALKLDTADELGVWDLQRIEIENLPPCGTLIPGDGFVSFRSRVKKRSRVIDVGVAVTRNCDHVLTVMSPLSGVVN